jgi:hypothetical protein
VCSASQFLRTTGADAAKLRGVCERALTAGGLHFWQGDTLFAALRSVESEELSRAAEAAAGAADAGAAQKAVEAAAARVRAVYRRQLAQPLAGHAATLAEYTAWEAQPPAGLAPGAVPPPVAAAAAKAAAAAAARASLEAPLAPPPEGEGAAAAAAARAQDPALLAAYTLLIAHEEREGDPSRVALAYERALSEFGTAAHLWRAYVRFLAARLGGAAAAPVADRALRNCPWDGALWAAAVRAAERAGNAARVAELHARALSAGLAGLEDATEVGLAVMDAARRGNDTQALRDAATAALDAAATLAPGWADPTLRVAAYWASCEAASGGPEAGRAAWEAVLKRPAYGACAEAWLAYAAHEERIGGADAARRVYKRVFARRLECAAGVPPPGAATGQEALCRAWLRCEREKGSADDYAAADAKVAPILEDIGAQAAAAHAAAAAQADAARAKAAKQPPKDLTPGEMKRMRQDKDPGYAAKAAAKAAEGAAPSKKKKREASDAADGSPAGAAKRARADAPDAAAPAAGAAAAGAAAAPERPRFSDSNTIFVKNLPLSATEEEVSAPFAAAGCAPSAVRLPRDRVTGAGRSFGYLEFATEEALLAALALPPPALGGKIMQLARSQPTRGAPGGGRGDGGRGHQFEGRGRGRFGDGGRGAGRGFGGRGGGSGPRHHVDTSAAAPADAAPVQAKAVLAFAPRAVHCPGLGAVSSNADFKAKLLASKAQPPQQ